MIYAEAILICTNIDKDEISGRIIDEEMKQEHLIQQAASWEEWMRERMKEEVKDESI